MMQALEGPHFTFVDPVGATKDELVRRVLYLSDAFLDYGAEHSMFVIGVGCLPSPVAVSDANDIRQIPASLEGLEAAQELARDHPDIQINMLFVSSFEHAKLCVELFQPSAITFCCGLVCHTPAAIRARCPKPFTDVGRTPPGE